MGKNQPYQPVLLRLLHSFTAVLVVGALLSGFWVYSSYDGRWGGLGLPAVGDIQGIHGTIAVTFLFLLPLFALYSFRLGDRRLIQPDSLEQLKHPGKPIWWINLHRWANTLMLLAATGAVVTGRMMKEAWLPAGDLNQPWYLAHLIAWLGMLISLSLHLLLGVKVGGVPLLMSMFQRQIHGGDRLRAGLNKFKQSPANSLLAIVEIIVMGGIFLAFILPIFH